ncbi:hypothetical protein ACFLYY_02020 [Patescibacteria group bacterium]
MEKTSVNSISGVGIIFLATNPSQIFIETKDDRLPIKIFRRGLCPIGGNWIGEAGKKDQNAWDTFCREVNEELNFESIVVSTRELRLLGLIPKDSFYRTPRLSYDYKPNAKETETFNNLKKFITSVRKPFGDYIITISKEVLDRADPENKHKGFSGLVSYWLVALPEDYWKQLVNLQNVFGNLSNESISTITSLKEIVDAKDVRFAYGHDRPFQDFFLSRGFQLAKKIPLIEGIIHRKVGMPLSSYSKYLDMYDVRRRP